jgi:hypothetical protein
VKQTVEQRVKPQALIFSVAAAFVAPCALVDPVYAQSANSMGVEAEQVAVVPNQNHLSAQFVLKNTNNVRVYILNARTDDSQIAFLASGEHLNAPFPAGVPFCNSSYSQCVANPNDITIDKFSYIEPGDSIPIAMQYSVSQKVPAHDTISFSVTFVAKFAKSGSTPDDVGPAKRLTFPFRFLPVPSSGD